MKEVPLYVSTIVVILTLILFYIFIYGFNYSLNRVDYSEQRTRKKILLIPGGIFLWLILLGLFSYNHFFFEKAALKVMILLALPVAFILVLILSDSIDRMILKLRPWWLVNFQILGIIVPLVMYILFLKDQATLSMFTGSLGFVVVGASAIPLSYICFNFKQKKFYYLPVMIWNIIGVLCLSSFAVISYLSMIPVYEPSYPVLLHYPYIWLGGFVLPFMLFLHLASIKQIKLKQRRVMIDF